VTIQESSPVCRQVYQWFRIRPSVHDLSLSPSLVFSFERRPVWTVIESSSDVYYINHCRVKSAPIPTNIVSATLLVPQATSAARMPAISRVFASEPSSAPLCRNSSGKRMAVSTAGGTKRNARRIGPGNSRCPKRMMNERRIPNVIAPAITIVSQMFTLLPQSTDRRQCPLWRP
jgi:hypothetical protein